MSVAQNIQSSSPILILPNQNRIKKSYPFLRLLFVILGMLVVWNLNIFGNRLVGNGQLFSPVIILVAILAFAYARIARFAELPTTAKFFGASLLAVICIGVLSWVAAGSGSIVSLASKIAKDIASPVVFFAAVWLASSMKKIQGELAERQVLSIMFFLSGIGVLTVFIPLVFPQWHYFIRGDDRVFVRFGGVYDNPNNASAAALTFMICGLAKTAQSAKIRYLTIAMLIGAPAIMLTGSRIGILCTVFVVFPLTVFIFGIKHVLRLIASMGIIAAVTAVIYFSLTNQLESSINSQAKRANSLLNIMKYGLDDETTGGRTTLAEIAIKMWKQSPVVGHGIGSSRGMLPYTELGPHNYYLSVLVETGVIGFLVFVGLWSLVGFHAFVAKNPRWVRVLIVGVFLALSFYGLSSHTVFSVRNQLFLIGGALGLSYRTKKQPFQ